MRGLRTPQPIVVALICVAAASGCQQLAILFYHATGGETVEAKFKLTENRLAIVMDDPDGLVSVAAANRTIYEHIVQEFTANEVKARVVPFEQWQQFRQHEPDYESLTKISIREIGEKLGADQVLYLRVTDFRLRKEPGAPVFQGRFAVRVTVLSTERKRDVRLWPQQEGGEEVVGETKPESSEGDTSATEVATGAAADLATKIAKLFYDHKEKD